MRRAPLLLLLAVLVAAIGATPAKATLTIEEFTSTSSTSEAGGHPDLRTHIRLGSEGTPEVAKNITFETPRGLFGNPSVLVPCTAQDFALMQCGPNSQVGLIVIRADYEGKADQLLGTAPIYNVVPGDEEAARFSFYVPILNLPIALPVTVRSATDYGLRFTVSGITQEVPLTEANLTFWGFPAANGGEEGNHELQRFARGSLGHPPSCLGESWEAESNEICPYIANIGQGFYLPIQAGVPNRPFTGNPSVCGQSTETTLDVETYQRPGVLIHADSAYPETTNCKRQAFQPVAQAQLTTREADAPSGLTLQFTIPQAQTKAASPSSLRTGILMLPEELTINPDAADGQSACPDSDAELGSENPAHCPDSSKVGTVTLKSESLAGDLNGSIYLAQPKPDNQYRLFLIAEGLGIRAKLIGKLLPDPKTGQVKTVFEDLPQLPLDKFEMRIFASDRGVFATPTQCSVYPVEADLFPWNPTIADERGEFGVGVTSGPDGKLCPAGKRPFEPKLNAGTSNSKAGSFSNFTLDLDREDGHQYLQDLGFTMPPGLTGSLRGIAYCPESGIAAASQKLGRTEQATPSCPAMSEIGTTNVAAGPGSHPFHAVGKMYMAGPFKGAPLSLVAITPALAGPYDYGTVVVRVAVSVDPLDAHVTAISDTVPSIIGGIPLRLRSIEVNLTKPDFILNPTNCSPMNVVSKGIGDQGTTTEFTSYFQAVNCGVLPFKPHMSVRYLSGGKARSKNPALEFALRTRAGDANIKSLSVTLPKVFAVDQRHLANLCSEKQLASEECAGRQPIGRATTTTPLLDQPLTGPVYAVSGSGGLPRLAFILNGQVDLLPRADTKTVGGLLRTSVPVVPDAPIGSFRLSLLGGNQGYLVNTRALCTKPVVSSVEYQAQNGRKLTQHVKLKAPCGRGLKAKKNKRNRAGGR
jgi:hypothetical protein